MNCHESSCGELLPETSCMSANVYTINDECSQNGARALVSIATTTFDGALLNEALKKQTSPRFIWTDDKHDAYLNYLEATFLGNLNGQLSSAEDLCELSASSQPGSGDDTTKLSIVPSRSGFLAEAQKPGFADEEFSLSSGRQPNVVTVQESAFYRVPDVKCVTLWRQGRPRLPSICSGSSLSHACQHKSMCERRRTSSSKVLRDECRTKRPRKCHNIDLGYDSMVTTQRKLPVYIPGDARKSRRLNSSFDPREIKNIERTSYCDGQTAETDQVVPSVREKVGSNRESCKASGDSAARWCR